MGLKLVRYALWALVGLLSLALIAVYSGFLPLQNIANYSTANAAIGGPFEMVNVDGEPVTQDDLKGRKYAIFFGYTFCPDVCPITMQELTSVLEKMPKKDTEKLDIIFVSVDHERDTPEVLKDYMEAFESGARIRGFTGSSEQIAKMAKAYRVYYRKQITDDGDVLFDHTASTYLFDEDGKFQGTIAFQERPSIIEEKLQNLISS